MASMLSTKRRGASFSDLQTAAADGQSWALEALTDEYLPRLVSFAKVRGAADPDGIAHVALVSVLRRLGELQFEAKEQFWAYLCQTARSRIIDEHRAAKPVDLVDDDATLNALGDHQRVGTPNSFDERVVDRDYVDGLLSPLTNEQRQVLEMRFFDDLSIEETASRTGRSQNAVKGLQRRAINAIIAAAAVILVLIAIRLATGGDESERISNAPAERTTESVEVVPNPDDRQTDESSGGLNRDSAIGRDGALDGDGSAQTVVGDPIESDSERGQPSNPEDAAATEPDVDPSGAEPDSENGSIAGDVGPFTVTLGSPNSSELDTSGPTVPASLHGTRVYCPVSHFVHGDPITGAAGAGRNPANMFWGNTSAGPTSSVSELAATGNGTCEGGTNDRSAYWMPALFDEDDQVVLPEMVLVEYKTFGGPGLDRTLIQAIPSGLELVADASVVAAEERHRSAGGNAQQTSFAIAFPDCVMVADGGAPVLSSSDRSTHLAYANAKTANGCPATHPYRIPQLTYKLEFAIPYSSGWYLATGYNGRSASGGLVAGAVSGWDQASMNRMVRCTIELIGQCEFAGSEDGRKLSRSQLPERFLGPNGNAVYAGSVTLGDTADRTPFGPSVPQFS